MSGEPHPGQDGKAPYCGAAAHVYRIALLAGDPPMRCIDCGHVKGQRRRKAA